MPASHPKESWRGSAFGKTTLFGFMLTVSIISVNVMFLAFVSLRADDRVAYLEKELNELKYADSKRSIPGDGQESVDGEPPLDDVPSRQKRSATNVDDLFRRVQELETREERSVHKMANSKRFLLNAEPYPGSISAKF